MNLELSRNFIAHGEALLDDVWVPVTIVGKCPKFGADIVQCTIVSDKNTWEKPPKNFSEDFMQLKGKTERGNDIWIPIFKIRSFSGSGTRKTWNGIAQIFFEGDLTQFDPSEGVVTFSAFIPSTPLALMDSQYDISDDGTITLEKNERTGVVWSTQIGSARLIDNYTYLKEKIGLDEALVRVQRCRIEMSSQFHDPISLTTILDSLNAVLDEPLLLLSFLHRRYITWYAAQATFFPNESSSEEIREAIAHYQRLGGYGNQTQMPTSLWFDVPVDAQALKSGLFQQLLTNLEKSSHYHVVHKTIPHLLKSHEGGYFQGRLGSVYLALESLIDGLSEDSSISFLLNSSRFKKLSKKLSDLIKEEIAEQKVAEGIINKLPELRRQAFLERLSMLFEKHSVGAMIDVVLDKLHQLNYSKLKYHSTSDVLAGLGEIIKRRNVHIHQGKLDREHYGDLLLLQNLVELWLLKLLDCPNTTINTSAYFGFYG